MKRTLVIIGILGLMAYVVAGLSRIRFEADITRLLPDDLKEAEGARLFLDHYSRQGVLIVTVKAEGAEEAETAAETLAAAFRGSEQVAEVKDRADWEVGGVDEGSEGGGDGTESGTAEADADVGKDMLEFVAWGMLNRPKEEMEELEKALAPGAVEGRLEESMKRAESGLGSDDFLRSYDPLGFLGSGFQKLADSMGGATEFGSADGKFRVIYVTAKNPEDAYKEKIAWVEAMWEVVGAWKEVRPEGDAVVEIGFTGEPAFVAEISSGMENDMESSAIFTLFLIGLIFWVAYRRFRPLLDLVLALVVIFLLTLATGGLLFRELSAISIGFASILIGLTVDYGVILYQEARNGGSTVKEVRGAAGKGILWAALTTAAAFASMAAGSVPGLAELGILVGSGVVIGAIVMLVGYIYRAVAAGKRELAVEGPVGKRGGWMASKEAAWATAGVLVGLLGVLAARGLPGMDSSPEALRPRNSTSQATMDEFTEQLGNSKGLVSVIVAAEDLSTARSHMQMAEGKLEELVQSGEVESYALPTAVWPTPEGQRANLEGAVKRLVASRDRLRQSVEDAGFEGFAFDAVAGAILEKWGGWLKAGEYPVWPESEAALGAVEKFVDWKPEAEKANGGGVWALGLLRPTNPGDPDDLVVIRRSLDLDGVYLTGGSVLSTALAEFVPVSITRIFMVLCALVVVALVVAFRRVLEVVLTLISVVVTIGAMLGAMQVFGITWNFMNLAALLLALGAGLDYSIHVLIDLRRHEGDLVAVHSGVGRALLVCGLTSVAGFGSLATAGNVGLSTLGITCALALAINTATAIFLLPKVWGWWMGRGREAGEVTA